MKNLRNFRTVGAIAIIIMAASAISMANTSDTETEVNPELSALFENTSWEFLGSRVINTKKESQTIRLSRGFGSMAKIQLRLRYNLVDIDYVVLHFKGGGTQEVELKPNVLGEKIYLIDVEGGSQRVRKITIFPNKNNRLNEDGFDNRELVEIWGVPASYLRSGYNEIYYPTVRYTTFGDLVKSDLPRKEVSSVFCPR